MRISRALAAVAVAAMTLTACAGTDDADTTDTTAATDEGMEDMDEESMDDMGDDGDMDGMDDESMDDMEGMDDGDMEGMDHSDMDMDMGSADGPRADEVEAAELRQNDLVLLDSAPAPFADASGTAYLALDPMTTLTVDVEGLEPGTEVVGHLHAEACAADGGPHFKFDPDGSDVPPNEVHIAATADDTGAFTVSVQNDMVASDAMSIVLHAADGDTTKALCADLAA